MGDGTMDIFETVESVLDSNDGEINGRTAVQKLVYLSKVIIPELEIPLYKSHYYGPFSPDLGLALEKLVSYSFVDEVKIPGRMYEGYKYRLTPDGKDMVKIIKTDKAELYSKVKKVVTTCKEFCDLKIAPLSYAAKIFFMLEIHPPDKRKMSYDDAIKEASTLGWKISPDDVDQGVSLLEKLNLVKVVR